MDGGGKKDLNLNCPSKAHHQKKASWELFFIIRTPLNWFHNLVLDFVDYGNANPQFYMLCC